MGQYGRPPLALAGLLVIMAQEGIYGSFTTSCSPSTYKMTVPNLQLPDLLLMLVCLLLLSLLVLLLLIFSSDHQLCSLTACINLQLLQQARNYAK